MIERNGWCYAEEEKQQLTITAVENLGSYMLRVHFNDGACRFFDGRKLLVGEVFAPLSDESVFADYKLDYETLTWLDGKIDVAPEFVYEHSTDNH